MPYVYLPQILQQEGSQWVRTDRTWRPKELIPDPYRRNLLKDAQERYNRLALAEPEFKTLERAHLYIKILRRMRFDVRNAQFAWRADDLKFLTAIANFFQDYGTVLRHLKEDEARGRLRNDDDEGV